MWTTALSIALESVGVVMTRGHFRNRGLWWRAIHPDVSAPSARQGFLPGATRIPAVRHGTEATIESPSTPSTRRAAPASFHTILLARPLRFWSTFYVDNRFIHRSRERRRGHDTRTLQESGTVVEGIHPDVSAPSARQGFLPGATRIPAVRHGTEATIESPSTPSTRRAAPASFHTILLARPLRFWSTFYVDNRFIHRSRERRRGHDTRTLQESGTVVERIHLDVSAPSARQWIPIRARLGGAVRPSTEATIEPPKESWARGVRPPRPAMLSM